ncbi:MAG: thiamine pyrophosphate-dependent enzyme [Pseudomonadota bacterium]
MKLYEALAAAFAREDVTDCFALLGDANMHWAGALQELGTRGIYTRHEHAAVAAAAAYARASGKVGVASVTCGPGLTQIMTILPIAVRARLPLVIFAGEAPLNKPWYNQGIDQAPFVAACGAEYRALHDPETMVEEVHRAFADARAQAAPIVLGMPFDLQQQTAPASEPRTGGVRKAKAEESAPDKAALDEAAAWIATAQRPVILAGLGAVAAGAAPACAALAARTGALLATTLPAKGLFRQQDFCLGVAGGYSSVKAREVFAQADLVIAIGARLAAHTFDSGKLTPEARVIHIDLDPQAHVQGRNAADLLVRADARHAAEALTQALPARTGWRSEEMRTTCAEALTIPDDSDTPDGLLHPLAVVKALSQIIPPDAHVINTSGHCAWFTAQMNDHPQENYTVMREFGAIGNGSSFAIGVAAAKPDRPIVLIDGDGSALMHIQELETMQRAGLHVLTIVLNDGAYGSEIHKLRADGVPLHGSVFGRPGFAAVARGFGLAGETITDLAAMTPAYAAFAAGSTPALWDVHISAEITSPQILRAHAAAHASV